MDRKPVLGFSICGSFCTFSKAIALMRTLAESYDILPVMSSNAYSTDTRFGRAKDFINEIREICGRDIIHTIVDAEPIGPKALCDIMLIAPCTGNTLAKLANSITDTSVTMAAKSHLRTGRPLVIALSTNDALSGSAKNIGALLNYRNIYFVPFSQDDPIKKERSCIADFTKAPDALAAALEGHQLTPLIL